jgi:hypothetical protein
LDFGIEPADVPEQLMHCRRGEGLRVSRSAATP